MRINDWSSDVCSSDLRFGDGEAKLAAISAGDVVSFLQHLLGRKGPYRDKTAATHMRAFFQYLFQRGVTETNLALCVPTIAQRWDARLPRFLSPEQIEALLAWVRDNPKQGLRDHAMLLMMARPEERRVGKEWVSTGRC